MSTFQLHFLTLVVNKPPTKCDFGYFQVESSLPGPHANMRVEQKIKLGHILPRSLGNNQMCVFNLELLSILIFPQIRFEMAHNKMQIVLIIHLTKITGPTL